VTALASYQITTDYFRDSRQLVSESSCRPYVIKELDRLIQRQKEQRPHGFAALDGRHGLRQEDAR
jgi:hypothetical protein